MITYYYIFFILLQVKLFIRFKLFNPLYSIIAYRIKYHNDNGSYYLDYYFYYR